MGPQAYELLQIESDQPPSPRRKSRKYLTWGFALASAVLISVAAVSTAVASLPVDKLEVQPDNSPAAKRGAGLLLTSGSELLLLLRNSKHNNNTWGLPGGNVEDEDTDLLVTAKREAQEEMGSVPEATYQNQILTKRGKNGKKHYTVFIGRMTAAAKAGFQPQLNKEHSRWKWFQLDNALQLPNLHPVVELMFSDEHKQQVATAMAGS